MLDAELVARIVRLVENAFDSRVVVKRVEPLAGDASTRRYARVWLRGSDVPATMVVMILADRGIAMSSDELAVFKQPVTELPYLNVHRFLEKLGVAIPKVHRDESQHGLILLEDVGDLSLWDAVQGCPETEVRLLYQRAIDQLLLIQLEGTRQRDESCLGFQQAFDERLYQWEFEHFIEYGLTKRVAEPVAAEDLRALHEHFSSLSRFLDRQPRYLSHRDYHSWNLYVQESRIRVLDFQDALLAAAPYDLATLLGDRDTRQVISPALEQDLIEYYQTEWALRGGRAWDAEEFWEVYAACALQKAFKVVGRFHYLHMVKGKPGYLRYLPATWQQIRRLLALRADLRPVEKILQRYCPEMNS